MKFRTLLLLSAVALCSPAITVQAASEPQIAVNTADSRTPLMIIRFNQPHVPYEQALYDAVSRALEAKPSAHFDVISVAERAPEKSIQKRYLEVASEHSDKVRTSLQQMGVPQDRLMFGTIIEPVKHNEIRIFVR